MALKWHVKGSRYGDLALDGDRGERAGSGLLALFKDFLAHFIGVFVGGQ
jgi:hypothetical protein